MTRYFFPSIFRHERTRSLVCARRDHETQTLVASIRRLRPGPRGALINNPRYRGGGRGRGGDRYRRIPTLFQKRGRLQCDAPCFEISLRPLINKFAARGHLPRACFIPCPWLFFFSFFFLSSFPTKVHLI